MRSGRYGAREVLQDSHRFEVLAGNDTHRIFIGAGSRWLNVLATMQAQEDLGMQADVFLGIFYSLPGRTRHDKLVVQ